MLRPGVSGRGDVSGAACVRTDAASCVCGACHPSRIPAQWRISRSCSVTPSSTRGSDRCLNSAFIRAMVSREQRNCPLSSPTQWKVLSKNAKAWGKTPLSRLPPTTRTAWSPLRKRNNFSNLLIVASVCCTKQPSSTASTSPVLGRPNTLSSSWGDKRMGSMPREEEKKGEAGPGGTTQIKKAREGEDATGSKQGRR